MSKKVFGAFTVRWAPQDGKDGADGKQGCIMRRTEWAEGFEYHNDSNATSIANPVIDVVVILATDGTWTAWECKQTHISSASNKPSGSGNSYWTKLNNMTPIYTPFIMADNGVIRIMQSQKIAVEGTNTTTTLTEGKLDIKSNLTDAKITIGLDDDGNPQLLFVDQYGDTVISFGFNGYDKSITPPELNTISGTRGTRFNSTTGIYTTTTILRVNVTNKSGKPIKTKQYFSARLEVLQGGESKYMIFKKATVSDTTIESGQSGTVYFTDNSTTNYNPDTTMRAEMFQFYVSFAGEAYTSGEISEFTEEKIEEL